MTALNAWKSFVVTVHVRVKFIVQTSHRGRDDNIMLSMEKCRQKTQQTLTPSRFYYYVVVKRFSTVGQETRKDF